MIRGHFAALIPLDSQNLIPASLTRLGLGCMRSRGAIERRGLASLTSFFQDADRLC